jgi:hypothetical protein
MDDRLSKKLVKASYGPNVYEEVRFFNNDVIQKAVDEALKNAKRDSVMLKADINGDGELSAVVAARPGDHWTIAGVFKYDFTDKSYSGGAQIVFEW